MQKTRWFERFTCSPPCAIRTIKWKISIRSSWTVLHFCKSEDLTSDKLSSIGAITDMKFLLGKVHLHSWVKNNLFISTNCKKKKKKVYKKSHTNSIDLHGAERMTNQRRRVLMWCIMSEHFFPSPPNTPWQAPERGWYLRGRGENPINANRENSELQHRDIDQQRQRNSTFKGITLRSYSDSGFHPANRHW